jgi:hypothetical protein
MLTSLYSLHPAVFAGKPLPNGSDLPAGWFPLVDQLFTDIEARLPESALETLRVTQIKEKWSGLRIYFAVAGEYHDAVEDLIEAASLMSEAVCMQCGAVGSRCSDRLGVYTLCTGCRTRGMNLDSSKTRFVSGALY